MTAVEHVAALRRTLADALARVEVDGAVTSCPGLALGRTPAQIALAWTLCDRRRARDQQHGDMEAALYWVSNASHARRLADVHAAAER